MLFFSWNQTQMENRFFSKYKIRRNSEKTPDTQASIYIVVQCQKYNSEISESVRLNTVINNSLEKLPSIYKDYTLFHFRADELKFLHHLKQVFMHCTEVPRTVPNTWIINSNLDIHANAPWSTQTKTQKVLWEPVVISFVCCCSLAHHAWVIPITASIRKSMWMVGGGGMRTRRQISRTWKNDKECSLARFIFH